MEANQARTRRRTAIGTHRTTTFQKRPLPAESNPTWKPYQANYFGVQALVVLVCLTASLLILPLILPPLQPPPILLLLLPIGLLAVLLLLAFMPADVRGIASDIPVIRR